MKHFSDQKIGDYDSDLFYGGGSKSKSKGGSTYSSRCYESHPELSLGNGKLYGGNCGSPIIDTADVYVGLDSISRPLQYRPWEAPERMVQQVFFPITDMCAPSSPSEFKKLIDWLCNQLQDGKAVHVGCIGGHGRTGTVLAALHKVLLNEPDAITLVRKLYCKKAVESSAQVSFLSKHFGITKVDGAKEGKSSGYTPYIGKGYFGGGTSMKGITDSWPKYGASEISSNKQPSTAFAGATKVWNSVNNNSKVVGVLF